MWIPSDRTFGIVVGLFAVFVMLLFFEPACVGSLSRVIYW